MKDPSLRKIEKRMKELVPEISSVEAELVIEVFTIIENEETRKKVYDAELKIMDEFKLESFNFHVTNKDEEVQHGTSKH
jgi:hypothetical protein